jgi:hypothetical protein
MIRIHNYLTNKNKYKRCKQLINRFKKEAPMGGQKQNKFKNTIEAALLSYDPF